MTDRETTDGEMTAESKADPKDDVSHVVHDCGAAEFAELTEALEARTGSACVIESAFDESNHWLRVEIADWAAVAEAAYACGFTFFSFLSGLDWLDNPELNGEKHFLVGHTPKVGEVITDPVVRRGGGGTRFQVFARVVNPETFQSLVFVADIPDGPNNALSVPTWTPVFGGANWHERETAEMFGFTFINHPDPRPIYLTAEFAGHPLRKDFVLAPRLVRPWPGLVDMEEMPAQPQSNQQPQTSGANPLPESGAGS